MALKQKTVIFGQENYDYFNFPSSGILHFFLDSGKSFGIHAKSCKIMHYCRILIVFYLKRMNSSDVMQGLDLDNMFTEMENLNNS